MTNWLEKKAANEPSLQRYANAGAYPTRNLYNALGNEAETSIREYWQIIARRKSIILLFAVVVLVTTITATFLITPVYRANLTLQIDRDAVKVLQYQDLTPVESPQDKDFYQTQYELLKSRTLAERVIDQLDLMNQSAYAKLSEGSVLTQLKKIFQATDESAEGDAAKKQKFIDYFLDKLTIDPVKNSRLVKVYFDSTDPILAASVVNTLAENFVNMSLERRFGASSYAKTFLDERLAQVKAKLEDSEQKLVDFARQHEIINIDEKQNISTQKLNDLNLALSKAQQDRMAIESLFDRARSLDTEALTDTLGNEVIQKLKQKLADLESEYENNAKIYKPAYPAMQQLAAQIEQVKLELSHELEKIQTNVQSRYDAAKKKETLMSAQMTSLKEEVLALQDRSIKYNILKREVDTNRELYENLLQRMKEVGVAGGIATNNIFVVDPAAVPSEKHSPKLLLNILLALIIGLFGGIGIAFLIEHLDDTIKAPDDVEKRLQIPLLGVIPAASMANATDKIGMLTHTDPTSSVAEAYRSVRTALNFSTVNGTPRVMLLTSSGPGEGKTTSAFNLATAYSQLRKNVLIIDADLRNPSLHRLLGCDNAAGLTNFLSGGTISQLAVRTSEIPFLSYLTSGPLCPNPAEMLASGRMIELLAALREQYDYVIIDGPPVLGLADAVVLSNHVDGTVFVVEASGSHERQITNALKRLFSANGHMLGGILTKMDAAHGGYGYYQNYYYYQRDNAEGEKRISAGGNKSF